MNNSNFNVISLENDKSIDMGSIKRDNVNNHILLENPTLSKDISNVSSEDQKEENNCHSEASDHLNLIQLSTTHCIAYENHSQVQTELNYSITKVERVSEDDKTNYSEDAVFPKEQLSVMSESKFLLEQVWKSEKKIRELESHQNQNHLQSDSLEIPKTEELIEPNKNVSNINSSNKSLPPEFPLIQSPLVTTPPYEYLILTKGNEYKCRIYLNPRIDQTFQQEIAKVKLSGEKIGHHPFFEFDQSNTESITFSKRSVKSEPTIHCFDPSEMDVELKQLLLLHPPTTNKIVRKKSRKERGSSVAALDSFYGTMDLEKVGHASYFIPELTPSERKAIGWKDVYKYGKWKYSTPNIPKTTSGQIPFNPGQPSLKSSTSWWKSISRGYLFSNLESSPVQSHTFILPFMKSTEDNIEAMESNFSPLDENGNPSLLSIVGSNPSVSSKSCFVIKNKRNIKKILRWLVPCMKNDQPENIEDNWDEQLLSASLSSGIEEKSPLNSNLLDGQTSPDEDEIEQEKHSQHNHHQNGILGCFPHYHHHHHHSKKSEVVGGDVLVSNNDSIVSFQPLNSESKSLFEETIGSNEVQNISNLMKDGSKEPLNDLSKTPLSIYEIFNNEEINIPFPQASKKVYSQSSKNDFCEDDNCNIISDDPDDYGTYQWKTSEGSEFDSYSTSGYSAGMPSSIMCPSMQLSSNSLHPTEHIEDDYPNYNHGNNPNNFNFNFMPEEIYEYNPIPHPHRRKANRDIDYEDMQETRFLDPKDMDNLRYQSAKVTTFQDIADAIANHEPLDNFIEEYLESEEVYSEDYDNEDEDFDEGEFETDWDNNQYQQQYNNHKKNPSQSTDNY